MSNFSNINHTTNGNPYGKANTTQRVPRASTVLNFDQDEDDTDRGLRESLLKESGHLTRSEQLLDEQFELALKTRENLVQQRSTINSMREGFNNITNQFTSVNGLIKKIRIRKRRDTIVVAIVFAICLGLFLYSYF